MNNEEQIYQEICISNADRYHGSFYGSWLWI